MALHQTFELEITRQKNRLKIHAHSRADAARATVRHFEEKAFDVARVDAKCREVSRLLNNANLRGSLAGEVNAQLKTTGFSLFEELLPHDIQKELIETPCESLVITIDDSLVHVPWELLHDGNTFLCRKFSMGRIIRSRYKVPKKRMRSLFFPLKVLILCDPCRNLKNAYREGDCLRKELDQSSSLVHADLFNRKVDLHTIKECVRDYDIIHYAGHADHLPENPSESGWLLEQGKFTPRDILDLSHNLPMPALVFSNACQTGRTEEWIDDGMYNRKMFGMAHAFLLSGVQHYIGTFWDVLDESSYTFSNAFYHNLIAGKSIGTALQKARETLIASYGEDAVLWASYVLYGDPDFRYFEADTAKATHAPGSPHEVYDGSAPLSAGAVRSLPPDRKTFGLTVFTYIVVLAALLFGFFIIKDKLQSPSLQHAAKAPVPATVDGTTKKDIADILKKLSKKYEQQKKVLPRVTPQDTWTSSPRTLSFLGFSIIGISREKREHEQLLSAVFSHALHKTGRLTLLERERISDIMEELHISTSDIADRNMALSMLGKLLGVRFICTGEIIKLKKNTSIAVRVIETATSHIIISVNRDVGDDEVRAVIESCAHDVAEQLETLHPLKGIITGIDGKDVTLNIGTAAGVTRGMLFTVLDDIETQSPASRGVGTLKIVQEEQHTSVAAVQNTGAGFTKGLRVINKKN